MDEARIIAKPFSDTTVLVVEDGQRSIPLIPPELKNFVNQLIGSETNPENQGE